MAELALAAAAPVRCGPACDHTGGVSRAGRTRRHQLVDAKPISLECCGSIPLLDHVVGDHLPLCGDVRVDQQLELASQRLAGVEKLLGRMARAWTFPRLADHRGVALVATLA